MEMNRKTLSWLFKPNAWMHPSLPKGIRKYENLSRPMDSMPKAPLLPRRRNSRIIFDLPRE
jgi:hypothetical protein